MENRMTFRGMLVMTTHFPILKDAQMILIFEIRYISQAHDLPFIFPRYEMVAEPFGKHVRDELLYRDPGSQFAQDVRLTALRIAMSNDAERERRISYEWMKGRIKSPEYILHAVL